RSNRLNVNRPNGARRPLPRQHPTGEAPNARGPRWAYEKVERMSEKPWWALTPQELEQMDAGLPELRELSVEEGRALFERVHEHEQGALPTVKWDYVAHQPAIRYAADIERLATQAARELETEFIAGVRAAFDHARGQIAVGLLTNVPPRQ